jgi:hypothetical protein
MENITSRRYLKRSLDEVQRNPGFIKNINIRNSLDLKHLPQRHRGHGEKINAKNMLQAFLPINLQNTHYSVTSVSQRLIL